MIFLYSKQIDLEVEGRHTLFGQPGKLKVLGFLSHGRMGRYADATAIARQTGMPADIAAVRTAHNRAGVSGRCDGFSPSGGRPTRAID